MSNRIIDLIGKHFGRWVVKSIANTKPRVFWNCECECGKEKIICGQSLSNGESKSCGCLKKEILTTHGAYKHPLYRGWVSMVSRCHNSSSKNYNNYGMRGISVFPEWRDNPTLFILYVETNLGPKPKGKTLDRKDNNGNYEPDNLRWATAAEQSKNRRKYGTLLVFTMEELEKEIERRKNGK